MEKDQTLGQIIWHSIIFSLKNVSHVDSSPTSPTTQALILSAWITNDSLSAAFLFVCHYFLSPKLTFLSFYVIPWFKKKKKSLIVLYWKCQTLLFSIHRFPPSSFPKRRLNPSQQASFVLCPHTSPLLLPIPALLYTSPNTTNLQISTEISPPLWNFP